jgi:hypothetical protein
MSTSGHGFIDNLISSVTKKKQNNDNIIRPALVPDMVPESFIGSSENFGSYQEFSSKNRDHAPYDSDSKSFPEEIKKHKETADYDNNNYDTVKRVNDSSPTVKNTGDYDGDDAADLEVRNIQEETQSKPSSSFSSSEDLKMKHSKRAVKDIVKKNDSINHEIVDNDISDTLDNRNHLIRENKNNVTKVSHIHANYSDLDERKNDALKENDIGDNANIRSNADRMPMADKSGPKIIKNSLANFESGTEEYSQSDLDFTTRDYYHHQQQNYENAIKVKSASPSVEEDLKNFEKLAGKDYYYHYHHYHHDPPHSVTSNTKTSFTSFYNREEPIININIGRIEVRAISPLDSEENNDYYNSKMQRQSTVSQDHLQRLSLSDYLKQRAEGKL